MHVMEFHETSKVHNFLILYPILMKLSLKFFSLNCSLFYEINLKMVWILLLNFGEYL